MYGIFDFIHNPDGMCHMWDCRSAGVILAYDDMQPEFGWWYCAHCWRVGNHDDLAFMKIALDRRYIGPPYQLTPHAESRASQREFDRLLPDGRKLSLAPFTFGAGQLGISAKPPSQNIGIFADSWDFLDFWQALVQFYIWDGEGEPDGWSRHFNTGRYRIDGDPRLEYIKDDDGTLEERIKRAVPIVLGADHVVLNIDEEQSALSDLPDGTHFYIVKSEHFINGRNKKCKHASQVYAYCDRIVVIGLHALLKGAANTVVRRLTGDNRKLRYGR